FSVPCIHKGDPVLVTLGLQSLPQGKPWKRLDRLGGVQILQSRCPAAFRVIRHLCGNFLDRRVHPSSLFSDDDVLMVLKRGYWALLRLAILAQPLQAALILMDPSPDVVGVQMPRLRLRSVGGQSRCDEMIRPGLNDQGFGCVAATLSR